MSYTGDPPIQNSWGYVQPVTNVNLWWNPWPYQYPQPCPTCHRCPTCGSYTAPNVWTITTSGSATLDVTPPETVSTCPSASDDGECEHD